MFFSVGCLLAGYLVTEMIFLLYFCCQFIWEETPPRNLILPHLAGFLLLEKYWILPSFFPPFACILFYSVFVESWLTFQSLQLRFWNVCILFTSLEFFPCFLFSLIFFLYLFFLLQFYILSSRMRIFLPFKDIVAGKKALSIRSFFMMPFCDSLSTKIRFGRC